MLEAWIRHKCSKNIRYQFRVGFPMNDARSNSTLEEAITATIYE